MDEANARTPPAAPNRWPELLDRDATTFGANAAPQDLPPGTKLYRVIDADGKRSGSYWNTSPPPATEAEYTSAVRDDWNGDGGYVIYTVPGSGLKAWIGPIAPQESQAVAGFVLPGGDTQVWVPYGTITPDGPPHPTPWNHP